MSDTSLVEMVWQDLKIELDTIKSQVQINAQVERSLISDSCPAYTLASAPLAAQGGLGNLISYATVLWISDGRKAGEPAAGGTGVLAVYQPSTNQWLRLTDYSAVVV